MRMGETSSLKSFPSYRGSRGIMEIYAVSGVRVGGWSVGLLYPSIGSIWGLHTTSSSRSGKIASHLMTPSLTAFKYLCTGQFVLAK